MATHLQLIVVGCLSLLVSLMVWTQYKITPSSRSHDQNKFTAQHREKRLLWNRASFSEAQYLTQDVQSHVDSLMDGFDFFVPYCDAPMTIQPCPFTGEGKEQAMLIRMQNTTYTVNVTFENEKTVIIGGTINMTMKYSHESNRWDAILSYDTSDFDYSELLLEESGTTGIQLLKNSTIFGIASMSNSIHFRLTYGDKEENITLAGLPSLYKDFKDPSDYMGTPISKMESLFGIMTRHTNTDDSFKNGMDAKSEEIFSLLLLGTFVYNDVSVPFYIEPIPMTLDSYFEETGVEGCDVIKQVSVIGECPERKDKIANENGFLKTPDTGLLHICMVTSEMYQVQCAFTDDYGDSWTAVDENVINLDFLSKDNKELYDRAKNMKHRMRSDDAGWTWYAVPDVESELVAEETQQTIRAKTIRPKKIPFAPWDKKIKSLAEQFEDIQQQRLIKECRDRLSRLPPHIVDYICHCKGKLTAEAYDGYFVFQCV